MNDLNNDYKELCNTRANEIIEKTLTPEEKVIRPLV